MISNTNHYSNEVAVRSLWFTQINGIPSLVDYWCLKPGPTQNIFHLFGRLVSLGRFLPAHRLQFHLTRRDAIWRLDASQHQVLWLLGG